MGSLDSGALGCVLGGAVGDALGAGVEFLSLAEIRRRFGADGLRSFVPCYGRLGAITDDTQMTLFTIEGLIRGSVRARGKGIEGGRVGVLHHAYLRWLHTQGTPWSVISRSVGAGPDGWLIGVPDLHARRAPGNTCLGSLSGFVESGQWRLGGAAENDSKGCGAVMRSAPLGLLPLGIDVVWSLARDAGALTHGNPSGYLPAAMLSAVVFAVVHEGAALRDAVERAIGLVRAERGHSETAKIVSRAVSLSSRNGPPTPEGIEALGGGWTGHEALAIAVWCALTAEDYLSGVLRAVNHSGDSDSTGAICGNLLGALLGVSAIPASLLSSLELRDTMETLVHDFVREVSPGFPSDEWGEPTAEWWERYPGH